MRSSTRMARLSHLPSWQHFTPGPNDTLHLDVASHTTVWHVAGRGREECGLCTSTLHTFTHAPSHLQPSFSVQPPAWHLIYIQSKKLDGKHSIKSSINQALSKSRSYNVSTNQHHCLLHLFPLCFCYHCPTYPSKTATQARTAIRNNLIRDRRERRTTADPEFNSRRPFTFVHSQRRCARRHRKNPVRPQRSARRSPRHHLVSRTPPGRDRESISRISRQPGNAHKHKLSQSRRTHRTRSLTSTTSRRNFSTDRFAPRTPKHSHSHNSIRPSRNHSPSHHYHHIFHENTLHPHHPHSDPDDNSTCTACYRYQRQRDSSGREWDEEFHSTCPLA